MVCVSHPYNKHLVLNTTGILVTTYNLWGPEEALRVLLVVKGSLFTSHYLSISRLCVVLTCKTGVYNIVSRRQVVDSLLLFDTFKPSLQRWIVVYGTHAHDNIRYLLQGMSEGRVI